MLNVGDLLRGALPPPKEKNRAALTRPGDIAGLLRAIEGYQGNVTTKPALQLSALLFVRPVEQWFTARIFSHVSQSAVNRSTSSIIVLTSSSSNSDVFPCAALFRIADSAVILFWTRELY